MTTPDNLKTLQSIPLDERIKAFEIGYNAVPGDHNPYYPPHTALHACLDQICRLGRWAKANGATMEQIMPIE